MATKPRPNPVFEDYEAMLEEAQQWAQGHRYDRRALQPVFQRVPEANDLNADRVFWLADVIEAIVGMAGEADMPSAQYQEIVARAETLMRAAGQYTQQRKRTAAQISRGLSEARFVAGVSGRGGPEPITSRAIIEQRAGRRRAARDRDLTENPGWTTKLLADSLVSLEEQVPSKWLPKLEQTRASGRGTTITAELAEFGCGAYGCVLPTVGDPAVVLKLTSDPSEAKFATEIADTLPTPFCVRYHMAVMLEGQRSGRDVYLLWRESATEVGNIQTIAGAAADTAVDRQHQVAKSAYMAFDRGEIEEGVRIIEDVWTKRCDEMAKIPELELVATGLLRAWREQGIFISDIHGGNLGLCARNGNMVWVVTDPGNVVVARAPASSNPPGPKKPCTIDMGGDAAARFKAHELLKTGDVEQWKKLKYIGRQVSWDDDDNEFYLELRDCACGSTLARPEAEVGGGPPPTENPKRRLPDGSFKPVWQFIRERLQRRDPDPVDVSVSIPGRGILDGVVTALDADHKHVTVEAWKGEWRYDHVPIENLWLDGTTGRNTLAMAGDGLTKNPLKINPADIEAATAGRVMRYMMAADPNQCPTLDFVALETRLSPEVALAHLRYLTQVGLLELSPAVAPPMLRSAMHVRDAWCVNEQAARRSPKWPRDVLDERDANEWLGSVHHRSEVARSGRDHRLAEFIRSFQRHGESWHIEWEFPGYLSISHPAADTVIAVGSDVRSTLSRATEVMLNISVLAADGDALAGEGGFFEPWPQSSMEFIAILQPFMDRYHP